MTDRGRGRPPIGPRLEIRVTPAQLDKLNRAAQADAIPIAEVVRRLIDRSTL